MLQVILPPLLAVAGGLGGFLLRRWELAAAFEGSGLAIPWAPPSVALAALGLLLTAALCALLLLPRRRGAEPPADYDGAFFAPGSVPCLIPAALAAACLLFAGVFGAAEELAGDVPHPLRLLLWAMCLLCFFCVLSTALDGFRGRKRRYRLPLLAPAYMCCLWLVAAYQQRAADPVVLDYVYQVLAIICTMLGLYFTAGFSFGRPKAGLCAFFCAMGVYFSLVTLADGHGRGQTLLFLFAVFSQLGNFAALLRRVCAVPPKRLSDQSNNTQEVTPDE